jgi:tRNA A37 threonylcarbamoyladenosine dehydratase
MEPIQTVRKVSWNKVNQILRKRLKKRMKNQFKIYQGFSSKKLDFPFTTKEVIGENWQK